MVMPAVMLSVAEFATVTDCWLVATNASAAVPIRPGEIQAGLLTSVPGLLFPDESAGVVPVSSSNLQLPARPLVTSPGPDGLAAACAEMALSPPPLTVATPHGYAA